MNVWTKDGSGNMLTWTPGGQNMADLIDFEYNSITYLIGLGAKDGSVQIIKLDGNGGGNIVGYAYSRVTVDYTGDQSGILLLGLCLLVVSKLVGRTNAPARSRLLKVAVDDVDAEQAMHRPGWRSRNSEA